MVVDYYKLREQPFGGTPDSRFLFLSATHREALGSLVYGLASGCGFVALIAKPGMGKTTLLFDVLNRLRDKAKIVFLFQTVSTPIDCMRAILADLGVHQTTGGLFDLQSRLNEILAEQSRSGKHLVIVFDEAQAFSDSVLEFVRMLSNFETPREKLIQIVLTGQPELADKLASPELLQLRQRISILACLRPFSADETALYIEHRLRTAGYLMDESLFTPEALALIAHYSRGIPRNINNLCFNAMSLGCALKRRQIDGNIIREVVRDLDLKPLGQTNTNLNQGDVQQKLMDADNIPEAVPNLDLKPLEQAHSGLHHVDAEPKQIDADDIREVVWNLDPKPLEKKSSEPLHSGEGLSQRGESISRELVRNLDLKSREQTNVELHGGDKEQRQIDEDWTRDVGQHLGLKLFGKIDPGKNEERVQEVQLFTSSVSAGSTLVSRLMKVATVSAMLLGMSVTGLQVHRMPASEVSAPTNPVAPFTASTPPAPINGLVPQLAPATNTIQVTPGQSLYRICSASFGTCSPELIQEIRKLNPHVDNPDHVESGQKLRIPARPSTLRTTADILEPAGMAPPEKRDVQ